MSTSEQTALYSNIHVDVPRIDPARVCITGHSRNGKQSLITAAFDERFTAVVGSSPGTPVSVCEKSRFNCDRCDLFAFNIVSEYIEIIKLLALEMSDLEQAAPTPTSFCAFFFEVPVCVSSHPVYYRCVTPLFFVCFACVHIIYVHIDAISDTPLLLFSVVPCCLCAPDLCVAVCVSSHT